MKRICLVAVVCMAVLSLSYFLLRQQLSTVGAQDFPDINQATKATAVTMETTSQDPWTLETTVGSIVADRPETARIFELVGIDYCCGGDIPLRKAAVAQNIGETQLLNALLVVGANSRDGSQRDWQKESVSDLLDHIVKTHHTWLRRELPLLVKVAHTVKRVHGEQHPELVEVVATIDHVHAAILPHLDDEEARIFPALRELESGAPPDKMALLLDEMHADHDSIGAALHRLRELTNGYRVPADACTKYREMLTGLDALERDTHQHVHLENNIVLPRALALMAELDNQ